MILNMNNHYRKILDAQIKKGLTDAKLAINLNHPYLIGKLREIVLHQLISPMLNNNYSIGNGKIIDYDGNMSSEVDLCIYSKNLHPPVFFSTSEQIGIFPIESVLNTVEVKSEFNLRNLKDAFFKFNQLDKLIITASQHDERGQVIPAYFIKPHYSLFAFNIRLKDYSPTKILEMYSKVDENWNTDPMITNICIAEKGWLCNTSQGWLHKSYDKLNNFNEEIIGFLSTLVSDLPRIESSRGNPRIGYYLSDALNIDKLIDGSFVNKPWGDGKYIFKNSFD